MRQKIVSGLMGTDSPLIFAVTFTASGALQPVDFFCFLKLKFFSSMVFIRSVSFSNALWQLMLSSAITPVLMSELILGMVHDIILTINCG